MKDTITRIDMRVIRYSSCFMDKKRKKIDNDTTQLSSNLI